MGMKLLEVKWLVNNSSRNVKEVGSTVWHNRNESLGHTISHSVRNCTAFMACFWENVAYLNQDIFSLTYAIAMPMSMETYKRTAPNIPTKLPVEILNGVILTRCTVHLLLFCTMTNKWTIISQIITLLHVSKLSCHPQGACNQYLAKLHNYFKCSCW
jgi:hypothetical protein